MDELTYTWQIITLLHKRFWVCRSGGWGVRALFSCSLMTLGWAGFIYSKINKVTNPQVLEIQVASGLVLHHSSITWRHFLEMETNLTWVGRMTHTLHYMNDRQNYHNSHGKAHDFGFFTFQQTTLTLECWASVRLKAVLMTAVFLLLTLAARSDVVKVRINHIKLIWYMLQHNWPPGGHTDFLQHPACGACAVCPAVQAPRVRVPPLNYKTRKWHVIKKIAKRAKKWLLLGTRKWGQILRFLWTKPSIKQFNSTMHTKRTDKT